MCLGWISPKVQWIVVIIYLSGGGGGGMTTRNGRPQTTTTETLKPWQPTNKKPGGENVLDSIQKKDVLSKVAVLSWRNFCCCAGGWPVTSFFMCLVLSCHLFVPPFYCSVKQAFSEHVEMTQLENAGCHYCCCCGDWISAGARKKLFFLREV